MTTIKVNVVDGDIAATSAHALIAAINPGGMWFGGIDGVISRAAGDQFHGQAAAALRADPDVKVVVCKRLSWHYGQFVDVVFVIDDLDEPLYDVIHRGLAAANEVGYRLVSIPAIRFGACAVLAAQMPKRSMVSLARFGIKKLIRQTASTSFPSLSTGIPISRRSCVNGSWPKPIDYLCHTARPLAGAYRPGRGHF